MTIEIQKNIPMPSGYGIGLGTGYFTRACEACEVGDSFFLPAFNINTIGGRTRSLKPKKFAGRTCFENDVKGVRVWRKA